MNWKAYKTALPTIAIFLIFTSCKKEPELSFVVNKYEASVGESLTFTNNTEMKNLYNLSWNFGDGGSASSFNATHAYSEPGDYTVTLSGTNRKGNKYYSTSKLITITPKHIFGKYMLSAGYHKVYGQCENGQNTHVNTHEETKSYIFDFIDNQTLIITDHLGNSSQPIYASTEGEYVVLNLTLKADIPLSKFINFRGIFSLEREDKTVTIKQEYEYFDSNNNNCRTKSTYALELYKTQ